MRRVKTRTKIDGRRSISFMYVKALIVSNIVCRAGCNSPASRDPRSSLKAMSPMMSTVKQLIHAVKSTKPFFFSACPPRRSINFEVWCSKTSCCNRRARSENPCEYSRRSLRWSWSAALDYATVSTHNSHSTLVSRCLRCQRYPKCECSTWGLSGDHLVCSRASSHRCLWTS